MRARETLSQGIRSQAISFTTPQHLHSPQATGKTQTLELHSLRERMAARRSQRAAAGWDGAPAGDDDALFSFGLFPALGAAVTTGEGRAVATSYPRRCFGLGLFWPF